MSRAHPSALRTATGLFTTIPVPPVAEIDQSLAGRAVAAFPWLGIALGAGVGGVGWPLQAWVSGPLGAVISLALLAAVTGALHLDGVADTADGLGSRRGTERALEIMKRSDIGPMGVVTLVFVLMLDVTALAALTGRNWWFAVALVGAVATARLTIVHSTTGGQSARPGGFGALFVGVTSTRSAALNTVAVLVVLGALGWVAAGAIGSAIVVVASVVALVIGALWRRHLTRRLGGLTGDTFGSIIEVVQSIVLVLIAVGVAAV